MLQEIKISNFKNSSGNSQDIFLTYQIFGRELGSAPVILVNHALTGNSSVTGPHGWWNEIIGDGKSIDTQNFSVLAFDMPGNGYSGNSTHLIHNYKEFQLRDIAKIYDEALRILNISEIFAGIGGSIGGALLWELAALNPELIKNVIPVATDYKVTQWVKALCKVQDSILNNSNNPISDARMQAMTFYRSPESLKQKFDPTTQIQPSGNWNIEGWLEYHGKKLEDRFQLASYKLMNHLLTTIDISNNTHDHISSALKIKGNIHIVTVNSDGFFLANENWESYVNLSLSKKNIKISEIRSIHGHDAFLIEHAQIKTILDPIFHINKNKHEKDTHCSLRRG
ncbi:alpha/beta fold hydrolase [Gillisia sp. M10.2A]|uniref:Alpha/beta fold hydrolase n=1 Tax=Gillisia lutea TaxID=2909668 RepID=A0ABS9EGJ3_9FLAO|nr:alpha/beta fold hydrolase [Gillisia lutea]MCF4101981.1 alpha/beta fold hydrolase [Gillisia lutea]